MIRSWCIKLILIAICFTLFTGCSKEQAGSNTGDSIDETKNINGMEDTKNDNIDETLDEINNDIIDDTKNEGGLRDMEKSAYKPTIDKPETLFENIAIAKAHKSVGYHNPLMTQRFGADPFAMVYGDRVYVYMTNDAVILDSAGEVMENIYMNIKSLSCISSDDLVNWTDHGVIKVGGYGGGSIWANNSWAPTAVHKNIDGKDQFFLYFADNATSIGVLRSDSPVGPFLDPLGKSLINRQTENCSNITWLFDPAVLMDDDGRAYLYFGGGVPEGKEELPGTSRVVELGEDMISLAGVPVAIEAPYHFEDSGINKIGDTYYYTYCSSWTSRDNAVGPYKPGIAEIIYMTSKNPMGPWEYQGSILRNPGKFFGVYGNNHHSMIQFKGQWYMFYHTLLLQEDMGLKGGYRSTNVDPVTINEDGSIKSITMTRFGVEQIKGLDPYQLTEAETFAWMGGVSTKKVDFESDIFGATNHVVTDLTTGTWLGLSQVDFGETAPTSFTAKVASEFTGNVIRITADKINGEVLGYLEVPNTGSNDEYVEVTIDIKGMAGVHDLFFTISGEGFLFDNWRFHK